MPTPKNEKISQSMKDNVNALKYKSVEDLEKGIKEYFKKCDENNEPYTMGELAYSLGIDRHTLKNYGNKELFFPQIKKARDKVEAQMEKNALMGKTNPAFTIFTLKNNYDWKDQQEVKTTSEVSFSPLQSAIDKLVDSSND